METGHQPKNNSEGKAKVYFVLAFIFLFVLAWVWSIDSSFIYLLLGGSICFLFLGFRSRLVQNEESNLKKFGQFPKTEEEDIDLSETLKKIFENKPGEVISEKTRIPARATQRRAGLIIFTLVISILIIIIISFSLSDDADNAMLYFQQGESFYNRNEYDSAGLYYRKAFSMQEDYPEALTGYGNTLMMKEQYDSAIMMYTKALTVDPEFESALYQKALVYYYQKNYDQSIRETKELLHENPSYFEAMQLIGDNYYNQEQYDSAMVWYDNAYTNGLRNRYLCHLLGYIFQTKGNKSKAISLYKEALQYDSSVVDIYQRLGELLPGEEGSWYRNKASEFQAQN